MTNVKLFLALSVLIIPISLAYAYDGTLTNCNGTELINIHAYQTGEKKTICYDDDNRGEGAFLHDDTWGNTYVIKDGQTQIRIEITEPVPDHPDAKRITGYEYHIIELYTEPTQVTTPSGGGSTGSYLLASHNETKAEPVPALTPEELCEKTKTLVMSSIKYRGMVEACQYDITKPIWKDTDGRIYERHVFHDLTYKPDVISWTDVTPFKQRDCEGMTIRVAERNHCAFKDLVNDTIEKATAKFDANSFVSIPAKVIPFSIGKGLQDCQGNHVTQKALDCHISKALAKEQQRALKIYDADHYKAKLKPSTTILGGEGHRTITIKNLINKNDLGNDSK